MNEYGLRSGEWTCTCSSHAIRSASCTKCLRCGSLKPDPVTLGRACFALGAFLRALDEGRTQEQAMQAALEEDQNRRGQR